VLRCRSFVHTPQRLVFPVHTVIGPIADLGAHTCPCRCADFSTNVVAHGFSDISTECFASVHAEALTRTNTCTDDSGANSNASTKLGTQPR